MQDAGVFKQALSIAENNDVFPSAVESGLLTVLRQFGVMRYHVLTT